MDVKKLALYAAFVFLSLALWTQWQQDYPAKPAASTAATTAVHNNPAPTATAPVAQVNSTAESVKAPVDRLITLSTDVLTLKIDKRGGAYVSAALKKYPVSLEEKDKPVRLFTQTGGEVYEAHSGLIAENKMLPKITYDATATQYELKPEQEQLTVQLKGQTAEGLNVTKQITMKRGDYLIKESYDISNNTGDKWTGSVYLQLFRTKPTKANGGVFGINSYTGASMSDPGNKLFQKVSFKQMDAKKLDKTIDGGWIAMQQHYFLSSWIPPKGQQNQVYTHVSDNGLYAINLAGPELSIPQGQSVTTTNQLYVGPENAKRLQEIAPGLNLTVDYGLLWFISQPIFWVMKHIHDVVGNWGWSIILITILIKLMFYQLSAKSYRSMANMRKLQPQLEAIKKRYADDKQKLSQATIELYKKEKINPLGGCLPILVQIPVFIALYWVLLESVELRQAPFILWIHDLSVRDPYFVLPVLMGISMLVQQKLNPPPPDPMQAKVMMLLPVVFTVLFISFPAGLVLYWVVNNSISILQQWYIMRSYEANGKKTKISK